MAIVEGLIGNRVRVCVWAWVVVPVSQNANACNPSRTCEINQCSGAIRHALEPAPARAHPSTERPRGISVKGVDLITSCRRCSARGGHELNVFTVHDTEGWVGDMHARSTWWQRVSNAGPATPLTCSVCAAVAATAAITTKPRMGPGFRGAAQLRSVWDPNPNIYGWSQMNFECIWNILGEHTPQTTHCQGLCTR